jgi:tetratricopeptide (TPR) repeat protein
MLFLALVLRLQGDLSQAIDLAGRAVDLIEAAPGDAILVEQGEARVMLSTLARGPSLAVSLAWRGDCAAADAAAGEAERRAQAIAHAHSMAEGNFALGQVQLERGDLISAIPALERAVSVGQELDLPRGLRTYAAYLASAYGLAGQREAARTLLEQVFGADLASDRWHTRTLPGTGNAVPVAFAAAGEYATAARLVSQLLPLHVERGHRPLEAEARWLLGECAAFGGPPDPTASEAHYRQALDLAEACERRPLAAKCRLGLGTVCRLTNRPDEARTWLAEALAAFEAMDMPYGRARAQAELATLG